MGAFGTLLAKFGLELGFEKVSLLATALFSSVTFLILDVNWFYMAFLNTLNVILFLISISVQYSSSYSSNVSGLMVTKSFILVVSITFTSGIVGHYYERSQRIEYELINTSQAGIEKTQSILRIMLPPFVRNRVKEGVRYIAENQGDVTILFCDICDFEKLTKEYKPIEFTSFLDKLYSEFDNLCQNIGVTKIETVGKTYMACAGLRDSDKDMPLHLRKENHARRVVELAFAMIQEAKRIQIINGNFLQIKIGINSGTVSAGVVGYHKPQFSLVGDTVNTASRMCSTLDSYNSIQISLSTFNLLTGYSEYEFRPRTIFAKGKGEIPAYIINEARPDYDVAAGIAPLVTGLGSSINGMNSALMSVSLASESSIAESTSLVNLKQNTTKSPNN